MKLRIPALLCGALLAMGAACSLGNSSETSNASGSDSGAPVLGSSNDAGSPLLPPSDAGAATDSSSPSPPPSASSDAQPSTAPATFLTLDTSQYLSNGTGGALAATSGSAGPGETFTLTDLNGGSLASGDPIFVANGGAYLSAADGGGGALTFSATTPGNDETFSPRARRRWLGCD